MYLMTEKISILLRYGQWQWQSDLKYIASIACLCLVYFSDFIDVDDIFIYFIQIFSLYIFSFGGEHGSSSSWVLKHKSWSQVGGVDQFKYCYNIQHWAWIWIIEELGSSPRPGQQREEPTLTRPELNQNSGMSKIILETFKISQKFLIFFWQLKTTIKEE